MPQLSNPDDAYHAGDAFLTVHAGNTEVTVPMTNITVTQTADGHEHVSGSYDQINPSYADPPWSDDPYGQIITDQEIGPAPVDPLAILEDLECVVCGGDTGDSIVLCAVCVAAVKKARGEVLQDILDDMGNMFEDNEE